MRTPRGKLLLVLAVVLVVAGVGWGVSAKLRSPADEAAVRKPPRPSLVTAPVERRKLVSTVVVSGTLEYGSPYRCRWPGWWAAAKPLSGPLGSPGGACIAEGAVVMEVNGRPVFVFSGEVPMHRSLLPRQGADVKQLQRALRSSVTTRP